MAILVHGDDLYPSGDTACLLCLGDFGDRQPVVFWRGGQQIYLHGGCAGSFVLRLARDAWQVEHDSDDGQHALTFRR